MRTTWALYIMATDELAAWYASSSVKIELGPKSPRPSARQHRAGTVNQRTPRADLTTESKASQDLSQHPQFQQCDSQWRPRRVLCDLLQPWIIGATQWSAPYNV
jgi:hypothetical protein